MQVEVAQTIFETVKTLPLEQQREVLELIEQKLVENQSENARPIWEIITEMSSQISDEEWEKLPADGSINHDHYLYGAPKKKL